jgi:hypothetical protein
VAGSSSTVAQRYPTFGEWCSAELYMDDGGLRGIQRSVNGVQRRCFGQGYQSESGERWCSLGGGSWRRRQWLSERSMTLHHRMAVTRAPIEAAQAQRSQRKAWCCQARWAKLEPEGKSSRLGIRWVERRHM